MTSKVIIVLQPYILILLHASYIIFILETFIYFFSDNGGNISIPHFIATMLLGYSSGNIHMYISTHVLLIFFNFSPFLCTGRFDVNFCLFHCKGSQQVFSPLDVCSLIQAGYWPGSISNTKYVFSQELFLKWDLLQKRLPGSSESGFLRSLEDLSVIRGRVIMHDL